MSTANKNRILRILSFGAMIAWMGVIFFLSSQDANRSSSLSGQVIDKVAEHTVEGYKDYTPSQKHEYILARQHITRKAAHFTEYTVLGVLALLAFSTLPLSPWKNRLSAFLTGSLYAVSDEVHQMFSSGRSCQWTDILLDSLGVLAGLLLAVGLTALVRRLRRKHKT